METHLNSVKKEFTRYKTLGEGTFSQVSDDGLFWQYNPECNSIAMIVKHLSGNMLSRWTDFLTTDGEKDWRNRETEFDNDIASRAELLSRWEAGWACLFFAINSLLEADLNRIVRIRDEPHTVTEAINRQLAHYPHHIGQIVFLGKMICNDRWQSLSIPRGGSDAFNARHFNKPQS